MSSDTDSETNWESGNPGRFRKSLTDLRGVMRIPAYAGFETEPGMCAWRQVDVCGSKRAVRASRRIPRIQMGVEESAEFEDSGGSWRAFVELRGIRQTPKLEAAPECTRHGKC